MIEYVIQIDGEDKLIKAYEVTVICPRRTAVDVPIDRIQIVFEDKTQFDEIVAKYKEYGRSADFTYVSGTKVLTMTDVNGSTDMTLDL